MDGLASDGHGTFYLTMPAYRTPALDWMHQHPWVKEQLAKLLPLLLGLGLSPRHAGVVLALDEPGYPAFLPGSDGALVSSVTAADITRAIANLTSIAGDWIARCPIEP